MESPLVVSQSVNKEEEDTQDKYEKESQRFYLSVRDFHMMDRIARKRQLDLAINHMIAEILKVCAKGKHINFDALFRWFNEKLADF